MTSLPTITDYLNSVKNHATFVKVQSLANGAPKKSNGQVYRYSGGFCVVFPFETPIGNKGLRCWHAELSGTKERTRIIADALHTTNLPYFVGFEYIDNGIVTPSGLQPVVLMDWVDGLTMKDYIAQNVYDSSLMKELADKFLAMVKDLHSKNISHGDLQYENIMIDKNGNLMLVDYDSMYVPGLDGYSEEIKGQKGYQHEGRWRNNTLTPKADYFSELVIYLSLVALEEMPELWSHLQMEDSGTMLFKAEDIHDPYNSDIFDLLSFFSSEKINLLTDTLLDFISEDDIDRLIPLEEVLETRLPKPIDIDSIRGRWKQGNSYEPKPKQDTSGMLQKIKGKMGSKPNISATKASYKTPDDKAIASKWR